LALNRPPSPRRALARLFPVIAAVSCLFAAALLASCAKEEKEKPEEYTVKLGQIRDSVICDGTIEPVTSVEVKSNASGVVEYRAFNIGDLVREGDVLFRLDKRQIEEQVTQARARLKSAKAQLALAKKSQTPRELVQLENAVAQAEFDLADAEERYNRIKELHEKDFATQQELDDAAATLERAKLKLELAQKNLRESNAGGTKEEVEMAEAAVTLAQADLSNALEELRYTTITAPMTGVILAQDVEVGDTVTSATRGSGAGTTLAVIGDLSKVYVRGFVDESDVGKVTLGMPAEVSINSYAGRTFSGKVAKIYPQATVNQNVTTFQVDVELDQGQFITRQTAPEKLSGSNPAIAKPYIGVEGETGDSAESDAASATGKDGGDAKDASGKNPNSGGETKKTEPEKTGAKASDEVQSSQKQSSEAAQAKPPANGAGTPGSQWSGKRNNRRGGGAATSGPVEIRIGMTADVEIIIKEVPDALTIPVSYVNFRAREPEVNVKKPDSKKEDDYEVRAVKLGFSDGVNIVVEEGLTEGDVILRLPKEEKDIPGRRRF